MIHRAKDLAPEQRRAIESLLGRSVDEDETISIRTVPDWLRQSWESARQANLDRLSMEEIDAEIHAARKARDCSNSPNQ